jgi:hypothetical protein
MFPEFSWAKEMKKHVTLYYPLFEVVPYNNHCNSRPLVLYGGGGGGWNQQGETTWYT